MLADIINNSITEIGMVSTRKLEKLIKKIKYINFTYNIKYAILNWFIFQMINSNEERIKKHE